MTRPSYFSIFILLLFLQTQPHKAFAQVILQPGNYKHYIDSFNANDEELYPQYIPNSKSWEFLQQNIPLLDCPDSMLEQTYYFRWWTYRKHIKKTPTGFVILEFLPDVSWAGKYNTINCAAALHVYEGRWLHNLQYVNDYANFWFTQGDMKAYSCWMADAVLNEAKMSNDYTVAKKLLPAFIKNYKAWERDNLDSSGLFWQVDDRDGMEVSICCAASPDNSGYRATINAYMYGEAMAIAQIASIEHQNKTAKNFTEKARLLKQNLQQILWDKNANFFKVLPRVASPQLCTARELQGYTPWYFNMPNSAYNAAWKYLMDTAYFFAAYGPTTAEKNTPGFSISYQGHECQWNGPSWPMATSITLTAMANVLDNYDQNFVTKQDYLRLLRTYAGSHQLTREDGKTVPWIDENLNPFTGDWISRTRLKNWENGTWSKDKGGVERGKDYNHSTFCDLVITGLIGLRPQQGNTLVVQPLVPDNSWDYFCLDNVLYHGKILSIFYDKTGERYHKGKGFFIFINGKKAGWSPSIKKKEIALDKY